MSKCNHKTMSGQLTPPCDSSILNSWNRTIQLSRFHKNLFQMNGGKHHELQPIDNKLCLLYLHQKNMHSWNVH